MADKISPTVRSANMSKIRSVNTKPELTVRRIAHRLGYRFRLHRKDLPGSPDIVFPSRRAAIFVHGCYWHSHGCKRGGAGPKSNTGYWSPKLAKTRARDAAHQAALTAMGWSVLTLWECEVERGEAEALLMEFLEKAPLHSRGTPR